MFSESIPYPEEEGVSASTSKDPPGEEEGGGEEPMDLPTCFFFSLSSRLALARRF